MIRRAVIEGRERYVDLDRGARCAEAARLELHAAQRALGDDELSRADLGRALQQLSETLRLCGELEESRIYKRRALEIWRALRRVRAEFLVRLQLALIEVELGGDALAFEALRAEIIADPRLQPYEAVLDDYEARALVIEDR